MKNKHSLISPSNFERRRLCHGSLNAEKDLPEQTSSYAEVGKMLHERTALYHEYLKFSEATKLQYNEHAKVKWSDGLFEEDKNAVIDAANYFQKLKNEKSHTVVHGEFHEVKYDLSFIHPEMKGGTADSVLLLLDIKTQNVEVHVIDYKFGKGVAVNAYKNDQLLLYYIGVIHDEKVKNLIKGKTYTMHLHIVQPFIKNSRWDVSDIEQVAYSMLSPYKKVAEACYDPNAKRTPDKKACQFCKAKPTCYALAKTVPKLDTDVFDLEDDEIAAIYDNRDLIKMYLTSIEEHIRNIISTTGFDGYELVPKLSNRKWTAEASRELPKLLGDDKAFEISKKLITITRAEKLVDKETMGKLTTKEVSGDEIVKIK